MLSAEDDKEQMSIHNDQFFFFLSLFLSGTWNGHGGHSKMADEWGSGVDGRGDEWGTEVVMTRPGSGFTMQHGTLMAGGMEAGTVFIAQPAVAPVVMARQNGRFGMAATSVRRF